MKLFSILMISLFSLSIFAATAKDAKPCGNLEKIKSEITAVHSKLANAKDDIRLEYEPENPEADEDGYVSYPDVNVEKEQGALAKLTTEYEAAAKTCTK